MSVPNWRVVYTNFAGVPYGEVLDAHDRRFDFQLLNPSTASLKLELVNGMTPAFLTNKEGLLLIYRRNKLAMTAELTSVEVVGDDGDTHELSVGAMETMFTRLPKRLLGKSSAGLTGPSSPTDQGNWLAARLADLNAIDNTGVTNYSGGVSASGNISGGVWRYKPFLELMAEMSASTSGFDFWAAPLDPRLTGGYTADFQLAPVRGSTKSDVIFEYGGWTANAHDYQYLIHHADLINTGYILPPDFPDDAGLQVATATDATSSTARGLREEVISSDLSDVGLRNALAALHIRLRKLPREQFVINPAPADGSKRVPQFLQDYNVGDQVRGRVTDQSVLMLDALVRIYGVTVSLSDEGREDINLKVINDGGNTNGT